MQIEDFPALLKGANTSDHLLDSFRSAIQIVRFSNETGSDVRTKELDAVKDAVNLAAERAWSQIVNGMFQTYGKIPDGLNDIYYTGQPTLANVAGLVKKLKKVSGFEDTTAKMDWLFHEVSQISDAVTSMKARLVKGRKPRKDPVHENPNKIVRTCPCCFRKIAISQDGTMVHHGYTRPGSGFQTSSCPGIRFKSLEVSNEGLIWLIDNQKKYLSMVEGKLADALDGKLSNLYDYRVNKHLSPGDQGYDRVLKRYISGLRGEASMISMEIPVLEEKLADWVQTVF